MSGTAMPADKFRLESGPPTEIGAEIAKNELRETPEVVEEATKQLKELVQADGKLYFGDNDEVLKIFLRPCKYYPKSALELMKRIADFKVKYANIIGSMLPDEEKEAMTDYNVVNVLVDRDQDGRRVLVANLGSLWITKKISGDQIFRLFYLVHVLAMQEPETQIRGVVVILDFEGLSMSQIAQLTPGFSLRLLTFIQEAMPLRLKQVHIVKQPFIFNLVWKVFKPFVKEKLSSRLWFHGSKMTSLHEHMSPDFLPANYGGKLPKIDYTSKDWYPVIKSTEEKVKDQEHSKITSFQYDDERTPLISRDPEDESNYSSNWLSKQLSMQMNLPDNQVTHYSTILLIGSLLWTLLYILLRDEMAFPNGQLFKMLSLFITAYFAGRLSSMCKLPPLLGMLITGIIFRGSGYFDVSGCYIEIVIVLRNLALTVILIKAGFGLDPGALMKLKFTVIKLGILPCAGEAIATAIICHYFLQFPWLWAFLLGCLLSAVSPAVVIPTLLNLRDRGYGNDKGISTLVIAASSLDDIFAISMFGVILSSIFSIGSLTLELIRGPLELIAGLILGIVSGFICACFPHQDENYLVVKRCLFIGLGGIVFVLGSIKLNYPGAGPLACIVMSFVANLSWKMQEKTSASVSFVYSNIWLIVQPILFSLIGSAVDVQNLRLDQVGYGILIVLGALAFRIVVCCMTLMTGSLNWKEVLFVNLAWLPKATVQAAFAPLPLDHLIANDSQDVHQYELASYILTTAVLAIIITAPIGAIAISMGGPRLLTRKDNKIPL